MTKVFLSTCFLLLNLEARENPFFPSAGEKDLPYTSNKNTSLPKLIRASLTLPSHARVIKKVTVEYENLDASIENKMIELNHSIDWHLPLFISQNYSEQSIKPSEVNKKVVAKSVQRYKKVASIKELSFFTSKNTLKIISSDKLIRNFLLGQPHRIVLDFKKESSLKTYKQEIENSVFTKIRIGNHDGYYRVVIELDGYYRYKIKKQADGCLITLQ
ncbi:AMIN domain-containing protein [Sulfurimonas sp.]|uniref:AMIN domain-containing protein n=1 Tax=Sulfurimonas sp. TaxID=2022749 RepID=UPI0039E3E5D2